MSEPGDHSNVLVEQPFSSIDLPQDLSGSEPFFFEENEELDFSDPPQIDCAYLMENSVNPELDIAEVILDLEGDESVGYSALEYLEIIGKVAALGAFNWYAGKPMQLLYAAGLATTALATAVHEYYDSDDADKLANAILKVELGVLKNYGMYILFNQMMSGSGPVYEAAESIFGDSIMSGVITKAAHSTIDTTGLVKWFGVAIPLNLTVTYMAESFAYVQNKVFLHEVSDDKLNLETDPFLTYRGPHTIFKRSIKNAVSVMIPDLLGGVGEWLKIPFKLAAHYAANIPIALYYNMDNKAVTAEKTLATSSSKVFGESLSEIAYKYLGLPSAKLLSVVTGTITYIASKIATKTKGLD